MNKQFKRSRNLVFIVMAMSFVPFVIAWIYSLNPHWVTGTTNRGELIIPPVTTERNQLTGIDSFSVENLFELNGRWVMVNMIPSDSCNEVCREALYKTRQLRLMMSKDLTRIRRVVLISDTMDPDSLTAWWKEDSRLIRVRADQKLNEELVKIVGGEVQDGMLILMDPLGNLMMIYQPGFDPYDVKSDMKKLLNISQIG